MKKKLNKDMNSLGPYRTFHVSIRRTELYLCDSSDLGRVKDHLWGYLASLGIIDANLTRIRSCGQDTSTSWIGSKSGDDTYERPLAT